MDYPDQDKKKGRAREIDQSIGERLKEIRKQKRLTQEDLAVQLGVSFQQIQKYENGKNRISFSRLYELSNFLNVSLDSFVQGVHTQSEALGLSDTPQQPISSSQAENNAVTQREVDELLQVYYSLEDAKLRKNLVKLVKSMVKNMNV